MGSDAHWPELHPHGQGRGHFSRTAIQTAPEPYEGLPGRGHWAYSGCLAGRTQTARAPSARTRQATAPGGDSGTPCERLSSLAAAPPRGANRTPRPGRPCLSRWRLSSWTTEASCHEVPTGTWDLERSRGCGSVGGPAGREHVSEPHFSATALTGAWLAEPAGTEASVLASVSQAWTLSGDEGAGLFTCQAPRPGWGHKTARGQRTEGAQPGRLSKDWGHRTRFTPEYLKNRKTEGKNPTRSLLHVFMLGEGPRCVCKPPSTLTLENVSRCRYSLPENTLSCRPV